MTLFFVISGFVLPLKTVSALHAQSCNANNVLDAVSGSLFRRPFRSFLLIIASTGITAILVRVLGLFAVNKPPRLDTWQHQLSDW